MMTTLIPHTPRRLAALVIALLALGHTAAQTVTRDYRDRSMSDVLIDLNLAAQHQTISFIYDELEDFTVTKRIERQTVADAIATAIGFYPIRMTVRDSVILVECTQKQEQRLIGRLTDEHGQPIAFANISLYSLSDTCFINGGVSNEAGRFVIPADEREVLVRVSYVGYQTLQRRTRLRNVGTWQLRPETLVLDGVEIRGSVPRVELRGASLVTHVEGTVLARMGTAEDLLARIPTVIRHGDSFEVLGRGAPIIYINSRLMRDPLELRSLQADQVKSIEVIQNPGARYDATTAAVIIIHTRRQQGEGLSVEANSYARRSEGGVANERLNLTYRRGSLELFATGFGAYNDVRSSGHYTEIIHADTLWTNHHETPRFKQTDTYLQGKAGLNWQISDHHALGAFYQHEYDDKHDRSTTTDLLLADGQDYDRLSSTIGSDTRWQPNHMGNIYYNGSLGRLSIDLNTDFVSRKAVTTGHNDEQSQAADNRDVNTRNLSRTRMVAEKLVVSYPVLKGQLSAGEEFTRTRRTEEFRNAEGYIAGSENETREHTLAPFIEITQQLGRYQLQAGLRYEHTSARYYQPDASTDDVNGGHTLALRPDLSRTFDNLFPSVAVSTSIPLARASASAAAPQPLQLSLSYAARTRRPTYNQLNSNVIYQNRLNLQVGNPLLRPSTIHDLSLMALWNGLFLQAIYTRHNDDIFYTTTAYADDQKVNLVTYVNYPHRDQLTLAVGMNKTWPFLWAGTTWTPQWTLILMKQWFECDFLGSPVAFNRPIAVLQLSNAFSLGHDLAASVDFMAFTTGHQTNAYFRTPKHSLGLSLSKDFLQRRLNVRLAASDILNGEVNRFTLHSGRMLFRKTERNDSRNVSLSLRYRFNVMPSRYRGTGAGNDEKSRL